MRYSATEASAVMIAFSRVVAAVALAASRVVKNGCTACWMPSKLL